MKDSAVSKVTAVLVIFAAGLGILYYLCQANIVPGACVNVCVSRKDILPENMINYEDLEDALALRIICPARAFSSRDIASKRICLRSIRKGQILTIEDFGLQKEYPEFAGEFPTLCNFQEEERIAHRSISIVYFPKALAKGSIVKATDIAIKRIPIEKLPNATLCDPYQVVGRPLRYKTRPGEYASTYNVFLTD